MRPRAAALALTTAALSLLAAFACTLPPLTDEPGAGGQGGATAAGGAPNAGAAGIGTGGDAGEAGQSGAAGGAGAAGCRAGSSHVCSVNHIATIAAGAQNTCAIADKSTSSGTAVWCWGANNADQLGQDNISTQDQKTPLQVGNPGGIYYAASDGGIAVGDKHACEIYSVNGQGQTAGVLCWGYDGEYQLGSTLSPPPGKFVSPPQLQRAAPGLENVLSVTIGTSNDEDDPNGGAAGTAAIAHTCALVGGTPSPGIKCWGDNQYGESVPGSSSDPIRTPQAVGPVATMATGEGLVAAGGRHTCAISGGDNEVVCWGVNDFSQLGCAGGAGCPAPTMHAKAPVPVERDGKPFAANNLAAGERHTCALVGKGGVSCWGDNRKGQCGVASLPTVTNPTSVVIDEGKSLTVSQVVAGEAHTCALTTTKAVYCWGANNVGQLGQGDAGDAGVHPSTLIASLKGINAIAAGKNHTCAIGGNNSVIYCWGDNRKGQLGNSAFGDAFSTSPLPVYWSKN